MYLLRLDDASEYMDTEKWDKVESILDRYGIKPLVGVIPNNQDTSLTRYERDSLFWERVKRWQNKGWKIAMHGYNHVYTTTIGKRKSEFSGIDLDTQREKIRKGIEIFSNKGIFPEVFFAPSHTFDDNTLEALKIESNIRIISDTIAFDVYKKNDFYFAPQQVANIRFYPFKVSTFCYHPNTMSDAELNKFEIQVVKYRNKFVDFDSVVLKGRSLKLTDNLMAKIIFWLRDIKSKIKEK